MMKSSGYGVVYTPDSLSDYVAYLLVQEFKKNIIDEKNTEITILDPACGEGALLEASERAFKRCCKDISTRYIGIDVDEKVVLKNAKKHNNKAYTFHSCDTLLPNENEDPVAYWGKKGISPELIIANPPWSSEKIYSKSELTEAGYKFDVGQYDSYVLFIELCLKLIKPDGYVAFIIPDSIFSSENRELRKFLCDNTQIKVISRLGEKLFAGVNRATTVLVIKNTPPCENSETICFRLSTDQRRAYLSGEQSLIDFHNQHAHSVMQRRFRENVGYIFDVDTLRDEESLLRKLQEQSIEWNQVFHFGRGVEISKSGMVVTCPHCGMAQGYSKKQYTDGEKKCSNCAKSIVVNSDSVSKIIEASHHSGYQRIYVGENLHRYALRGSCYIKMDVPGINYKEEKLYEPPKILIRKTGLGINACIDYESTYISQTVYSCNYLDTNNNVPLEYYLGVLNSRVLYYYYLKKYGENEWKSHPYFTKDIVFSLPIPQVTEDKKELSMRIAKSVRQLQTSYSRTLDLEIEKMIIELYGLTANEIRLVVQCINQLPDLGAINHMKTKEEELCLDI